MAKSKTKVRKRAQASRWAWLAQEGSRLSAIFARPRNQDEAEIFSAAYRRGATELARVRAFSPDRRQVEYLEQAVATAHFAAHRASAPRPKTVLRGLVFGMPDLIRRYAKYHLLALAITLGAAAIGMLAVLHEPSTYYLFVDAELAGGRNPSASKEFLEESLRSGRGDSSDEHAVFSAFLFQHNTRIAMLCFAVGIFLG
ncbi:MAG: hypothetical protein HUU29_02620, partial [Planctomycetaceae bacterium]|nr:hypothetical protein [Planctomycetaceae bacterium]